MNKRLKERTYINLAFVPFILFLGVIGIGFIEQTPNSHQTDAMFDDKLGYSIFLILFLVLVLIVWFLTAIATCIATRAYKKWFFLNLFSVLWLPIILCTWYLKQEIPIYLKKNDFAEKIENQVQIASLSEIDLSADYPILTPYIFNNNFYVLTGENLYRKSSLKSHHRKLLLSPTSRQPVHFESLQIFKLGKERFIEEAIENHPLFDTVYQGKVKRTVHNATIPTPDSILHIYYQLNQPDERCSFPIFMSDYSYLYRACDSFKMLPFHKDFVSHGAKHIGNKVYNELISGNISDFNKNYWKKMGYNFFFETPNETFYTYVRPHGHTKITKKAALELWRDRNEHHLYVAKTSKEDSVLIKKIGPFPVEPYIEGIYATDEKVYLVFDQKLFVINDY